MAKASRTPKYMHDGSWYDSGHYVRTWKEKREIVVQVWLNKTTPAGESEGDWGMPSVLGHSACVDQAIRQTAADVKAKGK